MRSAHFASAYKRRSLAGAIRLELGYTGHVHVEITRLRCSPRGLGLCGTPLRIAEQLEVDGPIRIPRRIAYYHASDRDSSRSQKDKPPLGLVRRTFWNEERNYGNLDAVGTSMVLRERNYEGNTWGGRMYTVENLLARLRRMARRISMPRIGDDGFICGSA